MAHAGTASARAQDPAAPELADALREVHGRRLHGFALLLALGDRALAARLAADALAAAEARAGELRHPERAAAWLRARVLRGMPRRHRLPSPAEERAALGPLDLDPAAVDGLAVLAPRERAALIASDVERLDPLDVETIAGRHGAHLERLLVRARRRYLTAAAAAPLGTDAAASAGPLVRRIRAVAERTMA